MSENNGSPLLKALAVLAAIIFFFISAIFALDHFVLKGRFLNLFTPSLGSAGVKKGQGFVNTSLLIQDDRLGKGLDIAPDRQDPTLIWVASSKNALSIQNGKVVSAFPTSLKAWHLRWIDLDNKIALMNVGSWINPSFLMDSQGKKLWTYGEDGGTDSMSACFNILGDSKTEFVTGFNGSKGLDLLDETGKRVWHMDEKNVWRVEAEDLNDDGKVKIVYCHAGGGLVVRNPDGSILKEYKPSTYVSDFTLTDWINPDGPTAAVIPDGTKYMFYSFTKSASVAEWETGFNLNGGKTRAHWVVWNPTSGKSLALLSTYIVKHQSLLTIYSEAGEMQYQELLPEATEGFGVVDGPTPGSHVLLVGLVGKVLKYEKPI